MILAGLAFLAIGLGVIAHAVLAVSTQERLRTEGTTTVAEVLDAQVVRTSRRGAVTNTRYEIKYQFQPQGQAANIVSGWEEAPEAVVRAATEAKKIEIRYLARDPGVNLPSASITTESGLGVGSLWQIVVGSAFALMGLVIFFLVGKEPSEPVASAGPSRLPSQAR